MYKNRMYMGTDPSGGFGILVMLHAKKTPKWVFLYFAIFLCEKTPL